MRAAPRTPPSDYALGMLARLYPAPLTVGQGAGPADAAARYLLVPSATRPRLVLPAGRPRAAAAAAHRQLTGRRLRTRVARVLTSAAVATGLPDRVGARRVHVAGPSGAESVETRLRDVLGRPDLLLTMPVGPPRSTRKPVLQVCDLDGRVLAFAKVGHDALTSGLVDREAQALRRLAGRTGPGLRTPQVLDLQHWRGLTLLVLDPLPLSGRRRRGAAARAALEAAVRTIAGIDGTHTPEWSESPLRAALSAQLEACGPRGAALHAHLLELGATAPAVRLGSWHGDLNPGNVATLQAETVVWDWERFEQDVPVGADLLHHDLHQWITEQGVPAAEAATRLLAEAPALLAPLDVHGEAARVAARLYLLVLAARYLRDNQAAAGSALGHVETWLLPALQQAATPVELRSTP